MDYDAQIAGRYSAYRPPLHEVILERLIKGLSVNDALDIGCGTGNSTHALLPYAKRIVGLEPSDSMLKLASKHRQIEYVKGELPASQFPNDTFGICAMAGSINYCHTEVVLHDIIRLSTDGALLLVYDFYIPLAEAIGSVPIQSDYEHKLNWDNIEINALEKLFELEEVYTLCVTQGQFMDMYQAEDGSEELSQVKITTLPAEISIEAVLYGTKYRIRK